VIEDMVWSVIIAVAAVMASGALIWVWEAL
jgi:hypothetical protein